MTQFSGWRIWEDWEEFAEMKKPGSALLGQVLGKGLDNQEFYFVYFKFEISSRQTSGNVK